MLEEKIKEYAMEKYAGDESKVAEFMEGFRSELEKKASEPFSFTNEVLKGVGKGIGGLAVGMGIAGISHAFMDAQKAGLHTKFLTALQTALRTSPILREADHSRVTGYAETIFKFAPHVATDANLLSHVLANAVHGEGIDAVTIKTLGELEARYIDNSGAGGFSPKTYV